MKLAYWPGCVSRGFTPELHGSVAKVAPLLDLELVELDRANCCGAGVIAGLRSGKVSPMKALVHPKLPDQKQVRRIFKEIESKDERIELNLYIVGEQGEESE